MMGMMGMMGCDAASLPFSARGEYKGVLEVGFFELASHVIPSGARNLYQFVNCDGNDWNDGL